MTILSGDWDQLCPYACIEYRITITFLCSGEPMVLCRMLHDVSVTVKYVCPELEMLQECEADSGHVIYFDTKYVARLTTVTVNYGTDVIL